MALATLGFVLSYIRSDVLFVAIFVSYKAVQALNIYVNKNSR